MTSGLTRRRFLRAAAVAGAGTVTACSGSGTRPARTSAPTSVRPSAADPSAALAAVERRFARRIGVAALDTATGRRIGYRAGERFLLCSTGKVATVATVLAATARRGDPLSRRVTYGTAALVPHSPVTSRHVARGLTVEQLCAAALTVSDNTAENLLLSVAGGPGAVTRFVRGIGDTVTRFDRAEPALNERTATGLDTTTPAAMIADLHSILLGSALNATDRSRVLTWMRHNTTGDRQIRAGTPAGWTVADKTGSGDHAESNDIGVLWPPTGAPVVLAVYTDTTDDTSSTGPAAIAATTRTVLTALA